MKNVYYEKKDNGREIRESVFCFLSIIVFLIYGSFQGYVAGMEDERERFIEQVKTYQSFVDQDPKAAKQFYQCMDSFDWETWKENR